MIKRRETTRNCDVCNRVVAVKRFIRFDTVSNYVTLRGDEKTLVSATHREDVHICSRCWGRMVDSVNKTFVDEEIYLRLIEAMTKQNLT